MSATASDSASGLAWRLLATLEGGTLLLATSTLLAYTARTKVLKRRRQRIINTVLISDVATPLGHDIRKRLEDRGCTVYTRGDTNPACIHRTQVDAIVIIGAERANGLDGISRLVTEDVYSNFNVLESLSPLVKRGGCIAWACSGTSDPAFHLTNVAYDAILRSSLEHIAKLSRCEPIWVERCETSEQTAAKLLAALFPCTIQTTIGSIWDALEKLTEYLDRCWKMVTRQFSNLT